MSVSIPLKSLSQEQKKKISKDLEISPKETSYGKKENILCFNVVETHNEKNVVLPFFYGRELNASARHHPPTSLSFKGQLNSIQQEIKDETLQQITTNNSILISLYCGAGKTAFSLFLCSLLKLKTAILTHRINLIDQWEYSINKFCPGAKIQVLQPNTKMNSDCDFYIMNVANVKKMTHDFSHIGILIVDEAHTICTENLSQSLFSFFPKYAIALTATPDRSDGLGSILDLFFGNRIVRKLFRPFNCYTYETNIKLPTRTNKMGKLDWNYVLENQCNNEERNELIIKVIRYFSNRNILVLCKRVNQTEYIHKRLKHLKESSDVFVSTGRTFDYDCRVLVSTFSKAGTGFDHPKLDMLIIASDVQEGIEQYHGRIFRREDSVPIVIDFLDKLHTMYKHYKFREEYYKSVGGEVKDFSTWFPGAIS
jgi:superfamily II DNA or RNA helicase